MTSAAPFEFCTLGAAQVRDAQGRPLLSLQAQPKRLALLAYLASGVESSPRRRDVTVALFWPELDEEHARGALRQALSYLRRSLRSDVVMTNGDEIGVDLNVLSLDAHRFEEASRAGQFRAAMELYRGDFLEGLFVADASPELDHWFDSERNRLRSLAREAAWQLAYAAAERGNGSAARGWGHRAMALSQHDESELRKLILLLDQLGDRAGALRAYHQFADELRSDFDVAPSPETQQLVAQVRGRAESTLPALVTAIGSGSMIEQRSTGRPRTPRTRTMVAVLFAGLLAITAYVVVLIGSKPKPQATLAEAANPDAVAAEAKELYLRGRHWWSRRGRESLLRSIGYFQQALDADPTFALAYSGMGAAYVQLGYGSLLRPHDAFPKARAAALRALQLDSTLAEPHATLGFVGMYYDWDFPAAEIEFQRALQLDPNYATGHEWYGLLLAAMGRFDEAMAEERRAQQLDPLSVAIAGTAAWVMHYSGQNEEATRALSIALREDSTFALGHFYLGRIHQYNGRFDAALREFGAVGPLRNWVPTIAGVGNVYGMAGRHAEARQVLVQMDSLARSEYVTAYGYALIYAALGQRDSAFAWLDRGVEERTHWMVWLNRDFRWQQLRADPRFSALTQRLRLPD